MSQAAPAQPEAHTQVALLLSSDGTHAPWDEQGVVQRALCQLSTYAISWETVM